MGLDVRKPDLCVNIKGTDQPAHLGSLISTFVIHSLQSINRVHVSNSRTFQGLHKDSHSVFKDYNLMKNTNLHYKILPLKV